MLDHAGDARISAEYLTIHVCGSVHTYNTLERAEYVHVNRLWIRNDMKLSSQAQSAPALKQSQDFPRYPQYPIPPSQCYFSSLF